MIIKLFDLVKLCDNDMVINKVDVNLYKLMKQAVLDYSPIAEGKNIDIIYESNLDNINIQSLCMKIRESKDLPIIMLSAKDQDMDKVMGLSSGSDDYISKPFNPIELLARIRAQLRRYNKLNPI